MKQKIRKSLMTARKAKDSERTIIYSTILGELERKDDKLTEVAVLRKMRDNAEEANNTLEMEILDEFLPTMLSDGKLQSTIVAFMEEEGCTKLPKNNPGPTIGYVNKRLKELYADRYDGKKATTIIQTLFVKED